MHHIAEQEGEPAAGQQHQEQLDQDQHRKDAVGRACRDVLLVRACTVEQQVVQNQYKRFDAPCEPKLYSSESNGVRLDAPAHKARAHEREERTRANN